MEYNKEKDSMGTVLVPASAYYGPQTQRAIENFPISGLRLPPEFINSLALVKKCAAQVNGQVGVLKEKIAEAIVLAAQEVIDGLFDDQFPVDVFQTGSGTSTNMNMNEVIAFRANEIITGVKVAKFPVHPNDHVNAGQSSNDVIPSAMHIAAALAIEEQLKPSLELLHEILLRKASEFVDVRKIGRTHLQDAVPVTLGQEFSGYARQIELGRKRIEIALERLLNIAIGGTAVGTGLNTHPEYEGKFIRNLVDITNMPFQVAKNHFEAQAAQDTPVETIGILKTIAISLMKIADDIRWMGSGPRCGIGEIQLPALQPGSSIMPGKVNPVIPESVMQVCAQVIGCDAAITIGGQYSNFEMNTMLPIIAYNLIHAIKILSSASRVFAEKCIAGITANKKICADRVEKSLSLAAVLVPVIGYEKAAEIANYALTNNRTIREACLDHEILSNEELNKIF